MSITREQGGKVLTVHDGEVIDIKPGGAIHVDGEQSPAIASLTAATGTAGNTISDVGGDFTQAALNNNFKSQAEKINAILGVLRDAGLIAES